MGCSWGVFLWGWGADDGAVERPRVLVIAEACNPEWVSVPLVGWSLYAALRGVADVHLVTQVRNRDALARAGLAEGGDFTAIDHEAAVRPALRLAEAMGGRGGVGWTLRVAAYALAYPVFERKLWRRFGGDVRAGRFDVVHQVTPLSPTGSPRTAGRCRRAGVPFVWGPLNGGAPWPREFAGARRREKEWLTRFRGLHALLPGHADARRSASAILCGSRHTMAQFSRHADKLVYLPENAVDPRRFDVPRPDPPPGGPLRVVSLGRLVPYKGADMTLEAMLPLLRGGRATLRVYGEGPLRADMERSAQGVPGVRFAGWVEHQDVPRALADADVLAFPSVREFGGGVALEAMAVGTPAVVVDYAGPSELVTPETGWLLPLGDRASVVAALRRRLEALADDRGEVRAKGAAAAARVRSEFTWPEKARRVRAIYDRVRRPHG